MFGAGHLAVTFLSVMEISDLIEFVVDDNPNKNGLFMPLDGLPIRASKFLTSEYISLCLLSLNSQNQSMVIASNHRFNESGGVFSSIFFWLFELSRRGCSMNFRLESGAALYAIDLVPAFTKADVSALVKNAKTNVRGRIRICTHVNSLAAVHEMLIVHTRECYVRPHLHNGKDESLTIIEGEADALFMHETGEISRVIQMGEFRTGRTWQYRLSTPEIHTLLIRSEYLVFFEVTNGPIIREQTVFPEWAPADSDSKIKEYLTDLDARSKEWLAVNS